MWKELRRVIGNKKLENSVPASLKCDELNEFFANVGTKITEAIPKKNNLSWKNPKCIYSFEFQNISVESVRKQLCSLPGDSKLDVLDMDSKLLKLGACTLASSITTIMNCSLSSGIVPSDWKLARVTPIYKGKGCNTDPANYRPISVLSAISMILERQVQVQVLTYLQSHDMISLDQFAFLKNHSTVGCLHRVFDDWYDAINEGEYIVACFLDIQKCFDSIDHDILITKLSLYGVSGDELSWFSNYLTDRSQVVTCNGQTSQPRALNTGVPQGSALGPLLFLIFINDMPQNVRKCVTNLFADDVSLYVSGKTLSETCDNFQCSVNDAAQWYHDNRLTINIPKSSVMLLGSEARIRSLPSESRNLNIVLDNTTIEQVQHAPYLGVTIDANLKWDSHIQSLCKKLSGKLAVLSRSRNILNKNALSKLYLSCIQPCLDYAISVWGSCSQHNKNIITRLQHRAARIITGNFDFVSARGSDLISSLRWQTLEQREKYFLSTLMYRCINGQAPVRLTDELVMTADTHDRHTRTVSHNALYVPQPNVELYRHSFKYRGAVTWNSLPSDLKEAKDIDQFKYYYKQKFFKGITSST